MVTRREWQLITDALNIKRRDEIFPEEKRNPAPLISHEHL